jgi:ribosomal protein L11 methyltransferase
MDYIELQITLSPYSAALTECLAAELGDLGYESFAETETGLCAYIPAEQYQEGAVKLLFHLYGSQVEIHYTPQFIADRNWNAVWESNFEPLVIAGQCTVKAPFHKNLPKTARTVVIAPKMAFGTGHHDTTYLMVEELLNFPVKGLQVLDMGCGTGILAILAAKCGAKPFIDAIDIDAWAKNNALENARLNRVQHKIRVLLGDASLIQRNKYNLILANINRNILLTDLRTYALGLKPGGTLMVSGIFTSDSVAIEAEARLYHLAKTSETARNNWAMMQFVKEK